MTAAVTGTSVHLLRDPVRSGWTVTVLAAAVVAVSVAAVALPWDRIPRPGLALFPVLTMAQLVVTGLLTGPTAGTLFTGFIVLAFLYTGAAASRTEVWLLLGPAALTWLVTLGVLDTGLTREVAIRMPIALTVWLSVGLATAARTREHRSQQDRLLGDATTDPLTGLGNRRALEPALHRIQAGDAVVVIDIDEFRAVNTRRGHTGADAVLAEFGQLVRVGLRGGDLAARTGGDEFVLLLTRVDPRLVAVVLGRVRESWQRACGDVSFSAGAAFRAPGEPPERTLVRADRNCYRAKERGRDQWALDDETAPGPTGSGPAGPAATRDLSSADDVPIRVP